MIRLVITQEANEYFKFVLDGDSANAIRSFRNEPFVYGSKVHIKTENGASVLNIQNLDPNEIQIVSNGTFTFTDPDFNVRVKDLLDKFIAIGFVAWMYGTGGSGGSSATKFEDLLDTFDFFGNDGKVAVVDESQQKLKAVTFKNFDKFTQLIDVPNNIQVGRMLVGNSSGTALEFQQIPTPATPSLTSVGYFVYADSATQATPLSFTNGNVLKLTNDTQGSLTNISSPPYQVSSLWNNNTNTLDFSQLSVGDTVDIRIDIDPTTTASYQHIRCFLKYGIGTADEYTLNVFDRQTKTAGLEKCVTLTQIAITSSNIKNSPAEIYFTSDGNGTLTVNSFYCRVIRRNINVVNVTNFTKTSEFTNDGEGTGFPFTTKQYVDNKDFLLSDRLDIIEAQNPNGVLTTTVTISKSAITSTFHAYINSLTSFSIAYNEIMYYNFSDSNDVYLLLVRGSTYGVGQTQINDNNYIKFTGDYVATQLNKSVQIYTSGAQNFTIQTYAQIIEVSINGKSTEKYTEVSDTVVSIQEIIESGQQVVIQYLVYINTNIVPYYTQAQVDALILQNNGALISNELSQLDLDISVISGTTSVELIQGFWYEVGDYIKLELSLSTFPNQAGGIVNFRLKTPTLIDNAISELIGEGVAYYPLGFLTYKSIATVYDEDVIDVKFEVSELAEVDYQIKINITYKKQ